jgi:DNA modification methylase
VVVVELKPVELVERCIRNSTKPGQTVLDPFGGSGTTLIAAEKSGRTARLMELDPKYVDVIVRRWQDWTGKLALRESDGLGFNELAGLTVNDTTAEEATAPGI